MNNLGDLLRRAGLEGGPTTPEPTGAPQNAPVENRWAPKVVVRTSRKGRGGKTVTLLTGASEPDLVARVLKKKLAVGARAEDDDIVIQGDQVERVVRWLEKQGVSRIVRG